MIYAWRLPAMSVLPSMMAIVVAQQSAHCAQGVARLYTGSQTLPHSVRRATF
jgi:hypothetical protein